MVSSTRATMGRPKVGMTLAIVALALGVDTSLANDVGSLSLVQCGAKKGRSDTDLASLDSSLQWDSLAAFCNIGCGPTGTARPDICDEWCSCEKDIARPHSGRTLSGSGRDMSYIFVSCNGVKGHIDIHGTVGSWPYRFSSMDLQQAKISALRSESLSGLTGCKVGLSNHNVILGSQRVRSLSENPINSRAPHYASFERNGSLAELHAMLVNLVGGNHNLRWVTDTAGLYELPLSTAEATLLRKLPNSRFVVPKPPFFKISPSLMDSLQTLTVDKIPVLELHFEQESGAVTSEVVEALKTNIQTSFGVQGVITEENGRVFVQPIRNAAYFIELVNLLATTPEISSIEEKRATYTLAIRGGTATQPLRAQANASPGPRFTPRRRLDRGIHSILGTTAVREAYQLDGKGVIAMCADTGIYMYHDQFVTPDSSMPIGKFDPTQRKVINYIPYANNTIDEGNVFEGVTTSDGSCGHGTHVCGLIAGSSASGKFDDVGTAPGAKLIIMDIVSQTPAGKNEMSIPSTEELFTASYQNGAKIFSFSWGRPTQTYSSQALEFDLYLSKYPDIIVFSAAGNNGDGSLGGREVTANCQGGYTASPAIAKNVITVGASINLYLSGDRLACPEENPRNLAPLTSKGPAPDGRRKPDIICPGYSVNSARSLNQTFYDSKTPTNETCVQTGTSQSTAACAGAGIILYQWLTEGRYGNGKANPDMAMPSPPSALIRALLIHSATPLDLWIPDLSTAADCAEVKEKAKPIKYGDSIQGFGVVDLKNVIKVDGTSPPFFVPNQAKGKDSSDGVVGVKEGQIDEYVFRNVSCSKAFKAVLVWTDPPASSNSGTGCTSQLVNDLDLKIIELVGSTNQTHYPVGFRNTKDSVNNVEVVLVRMMNPEDDCDARDLVIQVSGSRIASGPVQNYSLVASPMEDVYGESASENSFDRTKSGSWKPWMTITSIVAGALIVGAIAAVLIYTNLRNRKLKKETVNSTLYQPSIMGELSVNPRRSRTPSAKSSRPTAGSRSSAKSSRTSATVSLSASSAPSTSSTVGLYYARPSSTTSKGERTSRSTRDRPSSNGSEGHESMDTSGSGDVIERALNPAVILPPSFEEVGTGSESRDSSISSSASLTL